MSCACVNNTLDILDELIDIFDDLDLIDKQKRLTALWDKYDNLNKNQRKIVKTLTKKYMKEESEVLKPPPLVRENAISSMEDI